MLWFLTESKHRNVSLRTNQHSLRILSPAQLSLNSQGLIFKLFYQKYFEWKFSDEKFSPRCHPLSYPGYVVQGSIKPKVKQTKPKVKQTKLNQIKPTQTKQNKTKGAKILVWEFFPQECGPGSRDFCKKLSYQKKTKKERCLTTKSFQELGQVWGTFSESIGEQNLTRRSTLILRPTLSLVTSNGFPRSGCSRWSASTLSKVETLI